ncbi:MAG: hypothetical protein EBX61_11990, partial [Betaproteobacteria bacterium]|nr:hypothetical protein [Betaproteobacteria bacterium]
MLLFRHRLDSASVWLHNTNILKHKERKMARLKDIMVELQNEIYRAELTLEQIAVKYDVPMDWVDTAFAEVLEQEYADYDMGDVF